MASFISNSASRWYSASSLSEALDYVPEDEEISLIANVQHLIAPHDSEGGDDFVFE